MFTSKKLLITALFFSAIQSLALASVTEGISTTPAIDDYLNVWLDHTSKQIGYLDQADQLIPNPQTTEEKLATKISQQTRKIIYIHKDLLQQIKNKKTIIDKVVQNLEQLKTLKQETLQMLLLIKKHASVEYEPRLTEITQKNLQDIQHLKELAYQLLGLTDSKTNKILLLENKIQWFENSIVKLYYKVGFITPLAVTGCATGIYACLKTVMG